MNYYIFYFLPFCLINLNAQEISLRKAIRKNNIAQVASYLQNHPTTNVRDELGYADGKRALQAVKLEQYIENPYMQLSRCNKIAHASMLIACIYMFCLFVIHMGQGLIKDHKIRNRQFLFPHTFQTLQEIPKFCLTLAGLLIVMLYQEYVKENSKAKTMNELTQAENIFNLIAQHQKQFDTLVDSI